MFEQAFKNIDDVLRKEAGCTTELDYTEQTSWLLFLKYLDNLEDERANIAKLERNKNYTPVLDKAYQWENWASQRPQHCADAPNQYHDRVQADHWPRHPDLRRQRLFHHL